MSSIEDQGGISFAHPPIPLASAIPSSVLLPWSVPLPDGFSVQEQGNSANQAGFPPGQGNISMTGMEPYPPPFLRAQEHQQAFLTAGNESGNPTPGGFLPMPNYYNGSIIQYSHPIIPPLPAGPVINDGTILGYFIPPIPPFISTPPLYLPPWMQQMQDPRNLWPGASHPWMAPPSPQWNNGYPIRAAYNNAGNNGVPRSSRFCKFCKNNGETPSVFRSHNIKDPQGRTTCPILMGYTCSICGGTGPEGHTAGHCPTLSDQEREKMKNDAIALHNSGNRNGGRARRGRPNRAGQQN